MLFAFRPMREFYRGGDVFRFKGLDEDALYEIRSTEGADGVFSGAYLMGHGLWLNLNGDYASAVVEARKIGG